MKTEKKILGIVLAAVVLFFLFTVLNTSRYKVALKVVDAENFIGINPSVDILDFGEISRDNSIVRHIDVENDGNLPAYLYVFKTGELANLLNEDKSFFLLDSGQKEKISFSAKAPYSAEARKYEGNIYIIRLPKLF